MTTTKRVFQELSSSGLISVSELRSFYVGLDAKPTDGSALTGALVQAGRLTRFQESCVLGQRAKSLCLGKYVILEKLGEGGMGTVYKATHRHMKRFVALKVLTRKLLRNRQVLERFQREVQVAARLHHPNIVTAFDADVVGKAHFLVMEYVDGTNLHAYVDQRGPLSPGLAIKFISEAASGLEYAHAHGIVHRDIKPGNLLVGRDSIVRIADMGLARLAEWGNSQQHDNLTTAGSILGTLDYMAPEQAMNVRGADSRSDIYSLGCTLYYLLTRRPIYTGDSPTEILLAHRERAIPSLAEHCRDLPAGLEPVFRRMVAKKPADRFQSMKEVIQALEGLTSSGQRDEVPANSTGGTSDPELAAFLRGVKAIASKACMTSPSSETDRCQAPLAMTTDIDIKKPPRGRAAKADTRKEPPRRVSAKRSSRPQRPEAVQRVPAPTRPKTSKWILAGMVVLMVTLGGVALFVTGKNARLGSSEQLSSRRQIQETPRIVPNAPSNRQAARLLDSGDAGPDHVLKFEAPDSFVTVPTLGIDAQRPFTLEALVRVPDVKTEEVVTVLGWHGTAWLTYCSDTRVFCFNAGQTGQCFSNELPASSDFVHVAVVWDGRLLTLFVDGQRQQRSLFLSHYPPANQSRFTIGAGTNGGSPDQPSSPSGSFSGCVDEIRISSIARYGDKFIPPRRLACDQHAICLFHCDEALGMVLYDASPNGHHGHLHGLTWEPRD